MDDPSQLSLEDSDKQLLPQFVNTAHQNVGLSGSALVTVTLADIIVTTRV